MRMILATLTIGLLSLAASPAQANQWNFNVYLDGKKVGTHLFEVVDTQEQRQVQSIANFNVKFLFFTAYRYQHTAIEQWSNNCLTEFDAKTKVNGEPIEVSGSSGESGFVVEKSDTRELLPDCVMTFAYWNPEFLKQERLLNPQDGEFLDVTVEPMGADTLQVRGEDVIARRYKVTAKDIDLVLWYSDDDQWVGLQSIAKSGHIIRYELS